MKTLVLTILVTTLLLTGCEKAADWHSRTFFGLDCRDASLKDGHCVSAR
jgi:hypothetical protein